MADVHDAPQRRRGKVMERNWEASVEEKKPRKERVAPSLWEERLKLSTREDINKNKNVWRE